MASSYKILLAKSEGRKQNWNRHIKMKLQEVGCWCVLDSTGSFEHDSQSSVSTIGNNVTT
jgi:hypothetical protein